MSETFKKSQMPELFDVSAGCVQVAPLMKIETSLYSNELSVVSIVIIIAFVGVVAVLSVNCCIGYTVYGKLNNAYP